MTVEYTRYERKFANAILQDFQYICWEADCCVYCGEDATDFDCDENTHRDMEHEGECVVLTALEVLGL